MPGENGVEEKILGLHFLPVKCSAGFEVSEEARLNRSLGIIR